jgi:sulfur-oxidizing protein SoxZ
MTLKPIERNYKVGDVIRIKAFIRHPMDTGFAKNKATGVKIPQHYITKAAWSFEGEEFCTIDVFPTTSRNPQFVVPMKVTGGGTLKVVMTDNKGEVTEKTMAVKPK